MSPVLVDQARAAAGSPTRSVPWGWRGLALLGAVVALGASAACDNAVSRSPAATTDPDRAIAGAVAELMLSPAAHATDVSPVEPVTAEVSNGTLESVTLTDASNNVVKGGFDAARTKWRNSENLGYDTTYTLTVIGAGADRQRRERNRTFTTVRPNNYTVPYLRAFSGEEHMDNAAQALLDGNTYGVGQTIVVWFDEPIKDKAEAERSLTVTADPPVEGAWRWMSEREVRWRPREFWPSGTKVTVEANVYGRHFGGGLYGQQDRAASFTIGRSKVAMADSTTHRMRVYLDGAQVTTINGKDVTQGIPVSMGKDETERSANGVLVDYRTQSGPHVISSMVDPKHMTSASYGVTDPTSPNFYAVYVRKASRISNDGEFVHLDDWGIWAHGKTNTSFGCINVAPTYIYWFWRTFGAGDVVDVRNTGRNLTLDNGGDWTLSWEQWRNGSALR